MRIVKVFGACALVICAGGEWASAAYPPLDRPTPPPRCADGICYPNPETWGCYRTRWRRWPTDVAGPAATPPAPIEKLGPDIPPFETPAAEDEDRRAPPPTKPLTEEAEEATETPSTTAPPTTPLAPPSEGGLQTPPTMPVPPPGRMPWDNGGEAIPPAKMPWEDGGETTTPPAKMPWENDDQPTGDWDSPPTPPTIATVHDKRAINRQAPTQLEQAKPQTSSAPRQAAPADDPPPTLPIALASATY